jgi:hypothetical protein
MEIGRHPKSLCNYTVKMKKSTKYIIEKSASLKIKTKREQGLGNILASNSI